MTFRCMFDVYETNSFTVAGKRIFVVWRKQVGFLSTTNFMVLSVTESSAIRLKRCVFLFIRTWFIDLYTWYATEIYET
jgi:hypothetical protein